MVAMSELHVIGALRNKRAELAGVLRQLEQQLVQQRADLAHVDATMRLFDPDIRPKDIRPKQPRERNAWFRQGECLRLIYEVIRMRKKGPGGLEILVQHDGFIGIYSHLGMAVPSFAQGKRTVAAGEKLGVVGRTGVTVGTHVYFEMLIAGKPVDRSPYLRVPTCGREVRPPSLASSPSLQ
jgi:hypothetical protein